MATFSQKDIQLLFIGAAATKTTGGIGTLNDGEIGIFTPAGTRVTEATAATIDSFRIVKATPGGIILDSGIIKKADIKTAVRKVYVASSNKIVNLGFDGTSGSIDAANDNDYYVRINMREGRTSNHGGLYTKHGYYRSDATATQFEVAYNLHEALTNEFSKEPGRKVQTQMLVNHAGAALGGAETISYTKGSKFILSSGTSHGVVAGDAIRIGTAVTDPCYYVVSVNGALIEVNSFITEATAAGASAEVITAAQAATADCGLVLTGLDATSVVGKLHNDLQPTDFTVTLQGFGTTPQVDTAANPGTGTEKQVAELEFFCQGNEGDIYRMGEPNLFAKRAEVSGNYDLIDVIVEETYSGSVVNGPIHKRFTLAIPETAPNYAVTGTADDITDVLEVLAFGAAGGELAVS